MYKVFEFFKPCKFLTTLTVYFAFIVRQSPLLNMPSIPLLRLYAQKYTQIYKNCLYVCHCIVKCATILANICLRYIVWNYLYIAVYCKSIVVLYKRLFATS